MKLSSYSMTVRIYLIVMAGVFSSTALCALITAYQYEDELAKIYNNDNAEHVQQFVFMLDATPIESRPAIADIAHRIGLYTSFSYPASVWMNPDSEYSAVLAQRLGADHKVRAFKTDQAACAALKESFAFDGDDVQQCHTILVTLADGTKLRLDQADEQDSSLPPLHPYFLPFYLYFFICVAAVAYWIAMISTRPLRQLVQAANALGGNIEQPPLLEEGPTELREATIAFNSMQIRIRRYLHERTHMLAAIAHDLQTPLTRLRLRLEKVPDSELREKLITDLSATQSMVKEGLELARSMDAAEPFELLDLDSLLDSVCSDAVEAGQDVTHSGQSGVSIMARPSDLRRCLTNLVNNAIQYGKFAHVLAKREGPNVVISVIDGGPGIPEDQLERVFDPFYRLDPSRSRESGGTGLGLTIARNIAEKHGGILKLRNHHKDGLGLEAYLALKIC